MFLLVPPVAALQENIPVLQSIHADRGLQYLSLQLFFTGFGTPLQRTLQEIEARFPEAETMSIQKLGHEAFRNFEFENGLYQRSPYVSSATKKSLRIRQQRLEVAEEVFKTQWSSNMDPNHVLLLLTELKKTHSWIQVPQIPKAEVDEGRVP